MTAAIVSQTTGKRIGCVGHDCNGCAENQKKLARYSDLVELVEELHDDAMTLRKAIRETLDDNSYLADGEICTLIKLKRALRDVGTPWAGDGPLP